ncbi:MAG: DUF2497 domain-containing protein [Acetobacteraceae bacterium]|nr:DUF2497 domain-containing protein [Acetobacteraceae bacterium]
MPLPPRRPASRRRPRRQRRRRRPPLRQKASSGPPPPAPLPPPSQALRAATSAGAAPLPPKPETPVGQASLTLEEMVRQEIRPLLKSWLDENLPASGRASGQGGARAHRAGLSPRRPRRSTGLPSGPVGGGSGQRAQTARPCDRRSAGRSETPRGTTRSRRRSDRPDDYSRVTASRRIP